MIATFGPSTIMLATPHRTEFIRDTSCSSAWVFRNPRHVRRTDRDGTSPGKCDFAVWSPGDNRKVLIGGIKVSSTMGHSGILEFLNRRQYTSPSVSRNTQKFDALVHDNLANERDSTSIFSKLLGQELSDILSADIYLRCWMDFTSNAVGTEAPNFVNFDLLAIQASDEFNAFGTPATRVRRPADGSHWSALGQVFGESTAVGMSGTRSEQKYDYKTGLGIWREN